MSQYLKAPNNQRQGRKAKKLTSEQIREINELWDSGKTETTISKLTGHSVPVVNKHIGVKCD